MATAIRVSIRCDEPGCMEGMSFEDHNSGGLNVSYVVRRANDAGWTASAKRAKCPEHTTKKKPRVHAFVPGSMKNHCYLPRGRSYCFKRPDDPVHATENLS